MKIKWKRKTKGWYTASVNNQTWEIEQESDKTWCLSTKEDNFRYIESFRSAKCRAEIILNEMR